MPLLNIMTAGIGLLSGIGLVLAQLPVTPEPFRGMAPTAILGFICFSCLCLAFFTVSRTGRSLEKIAEKQGESNTLQAVTNTRLDEVCQKLGNLIK